MAPEKNLPQKKMPEKILFPVGGAEHQNFIPWSAAHRLGRVPQRIVAGQIAVADDFQRNRDDRQRHQRPHQQRGVTPD